MSAHSPSIVQGQSTQEENVQEGWDVVNGELKVVIAELRQLVSISTNKASTECPLNAPKSLQNVHKLFGFHPDSLRPIAIALNVHRTSSDDLFFVKS